MFHMINQLLGTTMNELDSIELIDFNVNTPNDFYSFLEYLSVTEYVVICDGDRILKLVNFLNSNYPIRFNLYNNNLELKTGHSTNLLNNNLKELFPNKLDTLANLEKETSPIKNELHLMLTGNYPLNIKNNLIKHLFVEKTELLRCIDNSILKNCVINSIIFYDKSNVNIASDLFPIMVNLQNEKETIESMNLIHMSKEEIMEGIKSFQSSGKVLNKQITQGIIDYSAIMNMERNNRLFYFEEGIYRDYGRKNLITTNFDEDFYEMVNTISYMKANMITPAMAIYPMVINISALLERQQMYMVTPFNAFFSSSFTQKHKNFNLIGLIIDDQYYLYHISQNKNYKVNKVYLLLLEFYLKNSMDSIDLKSYFPDKLETFNKKFYEFIDRIS
ncbi:hypothetical protein [Paucisalibacillus globulus]|uniref:hypothetical protein n=1 Tax=Paucisalibacillus globulus TaxID=351095 RepID=UPI0012EB29B3|nr:hypothetical protein [Paucisalibacillus globulus]